MLAAIDNFLNRITMYRLVLYYLLVLVAAALALSAFGLLSFNPLGLLFSAAVITAASWLTNTLCARFLGVPTNVESVYITALILTLIITPPAAGGYAAALPMLIGAAVIAEVSKYVINFRHKHIFNPAALAVVLAAYGIGHAASWWVGTAPMLAFVLAGGLLVIRKVQRFDAVIAFTATTLAATVLLSHGSPWSSISAAFLSSPLVFFASIMLTEPLTMPPTRDGRIAYGVLVGWLFSPPVHIGSLYFSPELALLVGNVFSYVISPKDRPVFRLVTKRQASAGVYDFVFVNNRPFSFKPGQYMEWTLGHRQPDSRGNRRYLTIASSPTESSTLLGVKFYENPSSYKRHLLAMEPGDAIIGGQLAGDFVLPEDRSRKLAFIAGGIGITPFRSMLKYLVDRDERRSIVMFYSNRSAEEVAYADVFNEAEVKFGIKTVYTLTGKNLPERWAGERGHINAEMIARLLPDFAERLFYVSGSHDMVEHIKAVLHSLGVKRNNIITDFFPGLA